VCVCMCVCVCVSSELSPRGEPGSADVMFAMNELVDLVCEYTYTYTYVYTPIYTHTPEDE